MDPFLLKLILSFFVGGLWITLATILAEKAGTKLGGVIGGLPSTSLISFFFIGWTQSTLIASQATSILPIMMGVSALFVVIYILLSKINFYLAIISALMFWFLCSLGLILLKFSNFIISLVVYVILIIISYYILEKKSTIISEGKKTIKYTFQKLLFRGILSGSIIALAVYMAKISGPLMGGALAAFPAVYTSTIIITHLVHGKTFTSAIMKVMVFSGSTTCVIFAIAVRYSYLYLGLIYGTIFSFIVALVAGGLIYQFAKRKIL